MTEIIKIEARNEQVVFIGDFNNHVGNTIPGNHLKVSHGGKLVQHFIEGDNYVLVNASDKVIGGPYTRYDPSEPNNEVKKSALDFVIVSKVLYEFIESLVIDKDLQWTPNRPNGKNQLKFTDHYAKKNC